MSNFSKFTIYALLLVLIGGLLFVGISYNGKINSRVKKETVNELESKVSSLSEKLNQVKSNRNEAISSLESSLNKKIEDLSGTVSGLEKELGEKHKSVTGLIEEWKSAYGDLKEKLN